MTCTLFVLALHSDLMVKDLTVELQKCVHEYKCLKYEIYEP